MPQILLIATGGTIAGTAESPTRVSGYRPAALPVQALVDSVPALSRIASLVAEQPFSTGSQHLTSGHWLQLAARVRTAVADPAIDGIAITHGTDTMEETALFLDLTCLRDKPIVLTGAMRPATALSADGPMNLLNAVAMAAHPSARGAGAMVLMNDQAFAPDRAAKLHTARVDAFGARDGGAIATMVDAVPRWHVEPVAAGLRRPSLAHAFDTLPTSLPRVDLVHAHVDMDPAIVPWLIERGSRGIVVAGTGNGTLANPLQQALADAAAQGCIVVRASRVAHGPVIRDGGVEDHRLGFVAAGFVSPHKARLLTALALAAGMDRAALQALLERY
jgi:L-asparaginase